MDRYIISREGNSPMNTMKYDNSVLTMVIFTLQWLQIEQMLVCIEFSVLNI